MYDKSITFGTTVDFKSGKKHTKVASFQVERLFFTWLMILLSVPQSHLDIRQYFSAPSAPYSKKEFLGRQRSIFMRIEEIRCEQTSVCAVPDTQTGAVCFFSSWLSSMGKNWVSNSWTCNANNNRGGWRADIASKYHRQNSTVRPAGQCVDRGSSLLKRMSSLRGFSSFSPSSPSLLSQAMRQLVSGNGSLVIIS